jgi:signal transduction histidine kinase
MSSEPWPASDPDEGATNPWGSPNGDARHSGDGPVLDDALPSGEASTSPLSARAASADASSSVDPDIVRATLKAVTHNSLLPITAGLSLLYLAFMFTHVLLLRMPNAAWISLLAAGSSVGALLLRMFLPQVDPYRGPVYVLGGLTAGGVLANLLWLQTLTYEVEVIQMILLLVASGFVFLSPKWYFGIMSTSILAWLAVSLLAHSPGAVVLPAIGVFAAAALGTVMHVVRRRTNIRAVRRRYELQSALQATEEARQSLAQRTEQVRALSSSLTMAEEKERRRIARVLHDDLQQVLYATEMNLQQLFVRAHLDEDADTIATEAKDMLDQAIATTRSLSANLSPPVLKEESLDQALNWLAERMKKDYDLSVRVRTAGLLTVPERDIRVLLFNLVRELLFNVVKHADVGEATVEATTTAGFISLAVEDEGKGFDPEAQDLETSGMGMGLGSVRKRLDALGGDLEIQSAPGEGTRVTLHAPLDSNSQLVEIETIAPEPLV